MLSHHWLQSRRSTVSQPGTKRNRRRDAFQEAASRRQLLEALENRCLFSFTWTGDFPVGPNPQTVATGDFNNDGKADLATANYNDGTVSVLLGDGLGRFGAARQSAAGS